MAEAIGTVASVLTLCQTVVEGASFFAQLARAPAEIKALKVSNDSDTADGPE